MNLTPIAAKTPDFPSVGPTILAAVVVATILLLSLNMVLAHE
jgi:hypothetical protein